MANFIIHALPRSRTKWLSEFLTYGDHVCDHDKSFTFRTIQDYKDHIRQPNHGNAETGVAQGWWLIQHTVPGIKTVVIRRDVEDVLKASLDIDISKVGYYQQDVLKKHLEYGARLLDRVSKYPGVLTVTFEELNNMSKVKEVFEHCLPYTFDVKRWGFFKNRNIQRNVLEMAKYALDHRPEINEFKSHCKQELRQLRKNDPSNTLWNY